MQALGYDEMDVKELLSEAIGNGIITLDDGYDEKKRYFKSAQI